MRGRAAGELSLPGQDRTEGGGQHPGLHVAHGPALTLQGAEVGDVAEPCRTTKEVRAAQGHLLAPLQRLRDARECICFVLLHLRTQENVMLRLLDC